LTWYVSRNCILFLFKKYTHDNPQTHPEGTANEHGHVGINNGMLPTGEFAFSQAQESTSLKLTLSVFEFILKVGHPTAAYSDDPRHHKSLLHKVFGVLMKLQKDGWHCLDLFRKAMSMKHPLFKACMGAFSDAMYGYGWFFFFSFSPVQLIFFSQTAQKWTRSRSSCTRQRWTPTR
jgi:hypothetical protein